MRDEVDLPTVDALRREWRRNPPVHHLVAAYLDYKAPLEAPAAGDGPQEDPDIELLLGAFGGDVPIQRMTQPIDSSQFDQAMAAAAARSSGNG